ncbi:unnamed protein product [Blepharisma stoltei]|uniref:Uncharacterized protein n=1 Tax=Blepharisma stoltei TaxID=1481888 RepID=A0AAU9I929_9CILI|nr:unnamed protein product [Blepharisma stoltei]
MGFCRSYCLVTAIIGAIFLLGLGAALSSDYKYIEMDDKPSHANLCYWTALVYAILAIVLGIWQYSSEKKEKSSKKVSDKKGKKNKKSEQIANPAFESASLTTSLLVKEGKKDKKH